MDDLVEFLLRELWMKMEKSSIVLWESCLYPSTLRQCNRRGINSGWMLMDFSMLRKNPWPGSQPTGQFSHKYGSRAGQLKQLLCWSDTITVKLWSGHANNRILPRVHSPIHSFIIRMRCSEIGPQTLRRSTWLLKPFIITIKVKFSSYINT